MNHSLIISPESAALQEEDAGKYQLAWPILIIL